ncbi:MAG TPA: thymidine phosphorylase [Firmicutes bacterium]|nr:thymidine phosphorylase [Bacillota bacterium]
MRAYEFILAKRMGRTHTAAEIVDFINGYVDGRISDAQAAAWCMAVYFNKLSCAEMAALTKAMVESGDRIDLGAIKGIKVDKHSTGGVGDKTTLVLGPMIAAIGLPFAKMSGRGLGHTGGTLDKLESIPGMTVEMDRARFVRQVDKVGLAVVGQTGNLVPADKKLYALRDETATVEETGLIAASIMSKKIAAGADAIVLDVKCGRGAFMGTIQEARDLAEAMVHIGNSVGRKTAAIISGMDQPLGRAIGNALEVKEAIATLTGGGPEDLRELCLVLGSKMAVLGGICHELAEARLLLEKTLNSGTAFEKLRLLVQEQGGDVKVIDHPEWLPSAARLEEVLAPVSGTVKAIDSLALGLSGMALGSGRERKEDAIDYAVGIVINKKAGQKVNRGDSLATLHYNSDARLEAARARVLEAFQVTQEPDVAEPPLILGTVE